MDVNRLLSDELSYELAVRGAPPTGSVAEKRQRLRGLIRLEKLGNMPLTSNTNLDAQTELDICILKLDELQAATDRFEFNNASNEKSRIQSRLLHVMGRLNRIISSDAIDTKGELLIRCGHISEFLEEAMTLVERGEPVASEHQRSILDEPNDLLPEVSHNSLRQSEEPPLIDLLEAGTSRQRILTTSHATIQTDPMMAKQSLEELKRRYDMGNTQSRGNSHGVYPRDELANSTFTQERTTGRRVSFAEGTLGSNFSRNSLNDSEDRARVYRIISQWDIKLEGAGNVESFIERVEELRIVCGLSSNQLMGSLITLFKGPALEWYRANIQTHHHWDDVTCMLRSAFLPAEYTDDLWEVINKRKQQPREKSVMFIAAMQNLLNKLNKKPNESVRIKKIRKNLLPHIRDHMILEDFDTVSQLTEACQRIENAQMYSVNTRAGSSTQTTEPNIGYYNRRPMIHAVDRHVTENDSNIGAMAASNTNAAGEAFSTGGSRSIICFNCRQPGHMKRHCPEPLTLRCYKCGKPNVTIRTCQVCSENFRPVHN